MLLASSRELTNIPISLSVLYEKEYNNLCLFLNLKKNKDKITIKFVARSFLQQQVRSMVGCLKYFQQKYH